MNETPLGRLEKVHLRAAWQSEAGDFTPWLAQDENIRILGEAIGLELEVEAQEKEVGPFRADILCREVGTDRWVLIENQLERTDHAHLGQLLTYAAGLNAVSIVWVAGRFTDEHRATLDWLNSITGEGFNFFGLEIELWRIGESPLAPRFNVVVQPNDWTRSVSQAATTLASAASTETRALQREFWTQFKEHVESRRSRLRPTKPLPHSWMTLSLGRSGTHLAGIASSYSTERDSYESGEIRTEVVLNDENAKAFFGLLKAQKEAIEAEVGEPLVWHNPEDARKCRIYLSREAHLEDRGAWPDYHAWLTERLERLQKAFGPRVRQLDPAEYDAGAALTPEPGESR